MFIIKGIVTSLKIVIPLSLIIITGCSSSTPTPTPEIPTEVVHKATATTAIEPTALPTWEPIPDGLVQLPVSDEARETATRLIGAEHPTRDDYRLVQEILGFQPAQLTPDVADQPEYAVNDRDSFFFRKNLRIENDYQEISATVRHISDHAVWWKGAGTTVPDSDIKEAARLFEEIVEPISHLAFGREWSPGIDNDRRVHFLLVNEEPWEGTFGYFSPINEYPTSMQPFSNQKEMMVINTSGVPINTIGFAGKLAHEFQHLIHWNLDQNEDQWLNEALSELAFFFTGAPESRNRFGTNAKLFALNPQIQLTSRPEKKYGDYDRLPNMHYGAEKSFMIYLLEQFGAEGPELIKNIANNPNPGVFSIQEELDKLPGQPKFNDIFASWLVAILVNRPELMDGQFGFKDYEPTTIQDTGLIIVRSLLEDKFIEQLPPYGSHHYMLDLEETAKVSFKGSTLTRLTPVDPPSGQYVWYSNRGDQSEFSLTRSFDLTDVDQATLNFKVWHELEEFYDYAYVEVSEDGGTTWQILKTSQGTDENPWDRSYGFGYTGTVIGWISESIDLTPFTGQEIQIRFQVLNDFSTNRDGIQIDDIAIPEIGFFDSAEDDLAGWDAKGFIRSNNLVPVDWILWLIKGGNPLQVERITLSPEQTAEFEIEGFGERFNLAAVIVSPTAPVTTMESVYELDFQQP